MDRRQRMVRDARSSLRTTVVRLCLILPLPYTQPNCMLFCVHYTPSTRKICIPSLSTQILGVSFTPLRLATTLTLLSARYTTGLSDCLPGARQCNSVGFQAMLVYGEMKRQIRQLVLLQQISYLFEVCRIAITIPLSVLY